MTLQHDNEFAGFPYFVVASLEGEVQLELKYAEQFTALQESDSYGPWTFIVQVSNMFRVETFNITQPGRTQSFLVQSGQRCESIRLLTSGSVTSVQSDFNYRPSIFLLASLPVDSLLWTLSSMTFTTTVAAASRLLAWKSILSLVLGNSRPMAL